METACILCNSMTSLTPECACGGKMLDSGPVNDYSGPYSPYYNTVFEDTYCHHLFTCPDCLRDKIISVPLSKV